MKIYMNVNLILKYLERFYDFIGLQARSQKRDKTMVVKQTLSLTT